MCSSVLPGWCVHEVYPCRIIHLLEIHEWIFMRLCYIDEPWMSIRVFLSEWIFRHGYYYGHAWILQPGHWPVYHLGTALLGCKSMESLGRCWFVKSFVMVGFRSPRALFIYILIDWLSIREIRMYLVIRLAYSESRKAAKECLEPTTDSCNTRPYQQKTQGLRVMISGEQKALIYDWYPVDILDSRLLDSIETWLCSAIFKSITLWLQSTDIYDCAIL